MIRGLWLLLRRWQRRVLPPCRDFRESSTTNVALALLLTERANVTDALAPPQPAVG